MGKCDTCGKKKYGYLCEGCIHDPDAMDKYEPMTNADRIRAMSDEELMETLYPLTDIEKTAPFCKGLQECVGMLANDEDIPDEKCKACLLKWLQQPAEVEEVTE